MKKVIFVLGILGWQFANATDRCIQVPIWNGPTNVEKKVAALSDTSDPFMEVLIESMKRLELGVEHLLQEKSKEEQVRIETLQRQLEATEAELEAEKKARGELTNKIAELDASNKQLTQQLEALQTQLPSGDEANRTTGEKPASKEVAPKEDVVVQEKPVKERTTTEALISAGVKAWNAIPETERAVRDQEEWEQCCKEVAEEAENEQEQYEKLMKQYYGIEITVQK